MSSLLNTLNLIVQPVVKTDYSREDKEARNIPQPSESMMKVSKSGSRSDTRALTKSSMEGLFCNMPGHETRGANSSYVHSVLAARSSCINDLFR